MAQAQTKKLGDYTFTVSTIPPREALPASLLVAEIFGPLIVNTIGSIGGAGVVKLAAIAEAKGGDDDAEVSGDDADMLVKLLSGAMTSMSTMNPDRLMKLVDLLARCTVVEGAGGGPLSKKFDTVFDGDIGLQVQWLAFAVMVNFGAYFRKAASAAAASAAKKQQQKNAATGADPGAPAGSVAGVAAGDGEGRNPS